MCWLRERVAWLSWPILLVACSFDESGLSIDLSRPDLGGDQRPALDVRDSSLDAPHDLRSDMMPDLLPDNQILDQRPDIISDSTTDSKPVTGPFGNPVPLTMLNSPSSDDDPSLTSDMLEIFFDSARPGGKGGGDIWTATRTSLASAWSAPTPVVALNSKHGETTPEVSGDGLVLYFASARPGGLGDADIFVATRTSRSASWSKPVRVHELSSSDGDFAPTVSHDHVYMIMGSTRPGVGDFDLYVVTRAMATDPWSPPALISELATTDVETDPWFNETTTVIYFTTNRPGGAGDWDIWRSTRPTASDPFGTPSPVAELNSSASDSDIWLSPDMSVAYLSSNRSGDSDLFIATR